MFLSLEIACEYCELQAHRLISLFADCGYTPLVVHGETYYSIELLNVILATLDVFDVIGGA